MTQSSYPKVRIMERIKRLIYPVRDKAWRQKRGCWRGINYNIPMPGEKVVPPPTPRPTQSSPTTTREEI